MRFLNPKYNSVSGVIFFLFVCLKRFSCLLNTYCHVLMPAELSPRSLVTTGMWVVLVVSSQDTWACNDNITELFVK